MNVVTAVTTAQGTIKLMTTQEQDQPTATSESAELGKARAAARKPPAATTKAKSTRKPSRGKKAPKRRPKAKAATPGQGQHSKLGHPAIAFGQRYFGNFLSTL
jgi:hypothetical protein